MTSTPPFRRILIANRGEIAVRVIRACRELGSETVAVYSEADREALHVRLADQAVLLGPPPPGASYLQAGRIIQAALETGAEAVHPGYGFLAENAAFAQAVVEAGLTFIGPPPGVIRAMGDKAAARARMEQAGVPVVPGYQGDDAPEALREAAQRIGYPVLVKAAAGGGGKGMRIVHRPEDLDEAVAAARREAQHAFGDPRLLLEKYIPRAHHVEFQILADAHGHIVHLFERECSVQRRYQKIIEETPSPLLDEDLRRRMGQAAVAAARAVGYVNAGTVEFIVDPDTRAFYFLEMNTRLQVEHPITELVVGLDLVQWQIRIAAGEPFPYSQEALIQRGHAIECRLYAEDPASGFLPSTGDLLQVRLPQGPGVRVDSGVTTGDTVTHHYDPLLAKIIVHAESREAAIRRMDAALRQTVVHGVTTNAAFLRVVLAHEDFRAGQVDTRWVERTFDAWTPAPPPDPVLAALALSEILTPSVTLLTGPQEEAPRPGRDPYSPWKAPL